MRRNIRPEKAKHCPLIDQGCLKGDCEIYNERLSRCEIGLLAYNLYMLSDSINRQLEEISEPAGVGSRQPNIR